MANTFQQSVLTPEKAVLEQRGISLTAPGSQGYLGILAHHAPLITDLIPGKLTLKDEQGREKLFAVSGGFLEVSDNRATVLADAIESPDEIDVDRAQKSRQRASERLMDTRGHWDVDRAQASLLRALNRLRIAGRAS